MAFILFLLVLFRYRYEATDAEARRSRLLTEVAALATITALLGLVLAVGRHAYALVQLSAHEVGNKQAMGRLAVQSVLAVVSQAPGLIAAYILYRSQTATPPEREAAVEEP